MAHETPIPIRVNIPGFIKCECGTHYAAFMYDDCPTCYEEEYARFLQTIRARVLWRRSVPRPPSPDQSVPSEFGSDDELINFFN